jgi:hypothetical protein
MKEFQEKQTMKRLLIMVVAGLLLAGQAYAENSLLPAILIGDFLPALD